MSAFAHSLGLEVHAGHGLTYDTVKPVAAFPEGGYACLNAVRAVRGSSPSSAQLMREGAAGAHSLRKHGPIVSHAPVRGT